MLFQFSTYRNAEFRRKKGHSKENLIGIARLGGVRRRQRCSHAEMGGGHSPTIAMIPR